MRDIGMVQRWIATSVAREALVWESLADGQSGRRGFRGSAIGRIPVVIRVVGGFRSRLWGGLLVAVQIFSVV